MAGSGVPPEERLRSIIQILESSTLRELKYADDDMSVSVRREAHVERSEAAPLTGTAQVEKGLSAHFVRSPFVGTMRTLTPSVDERQVSAESVLGAVEAMGLTHDIEAGVVGTVQRTLVQNGDVVQYGDLLFEISRDE